MYTRYDRVTTRKFEGKNLFNVTAQKRGNCNDDDDDDDGYDDVDNVIDSYSPTTPQSFDARTNYEI